MSTRALGIDLGSKRIGVALSASTLATPYEVVQRSGDKARDHRRIGELVDEAGATVVVVGLPLSLDGSVGPAAQRALDEIEVLASALDVPVETWDERLSTVTAEQSLREQNLKGPARRKVVDMVAASVILQGWLDAQQEQVRAASPDMENS
ncbi:Holliday junction resolvase RuvX [Actinospongicola halichondriae]|uniref:Holliday junction resolvase RuvX n=1 Tax=Actinospongicola halichondriae TaxID=3236844 RepID=UPI003D458830